MFHRNVRYAFKVRDLSLRLGEVLNLKTLQGELDHLTSLGLTNEDLSFLRETELFLPGFLDYLEWSLELPAVQVENRNGWLHVEYEAEAPNAVLLESMVLAVISEMFNEINSDPIFVSKEGKKRLQNKIEIFEQAKVPIIEFGTRRRDSGSWQREVVEKLKNSKVKLIGTSNPFLAREFEIPVIGTMAHQLFMISAAIFDHNPVFGQQFVLEGWRSLYGNRLNTFLTDTFTTEFFLKHFNKNDYPPNRTYRIDSGDPIEIGRRLLQFDYRANLIFSDALDENKILAIERAFSRPHRTEQGKGISYGIGTSLTNDVGPKPLNAVIKPVRVDDIPVVKISDDLAKASGDPDLINHYLNVIGNE